MARTSTRVRDSGQAYKPNKADWLDGKWAGLKRAKDEDDPRKR
jgi:2-oxoglutarate dehydrogenase E1 component